MGTLDGACCRCGSSWDSCSWFTALQKLFGFGLAGTAGFLGSLGIPLPMVAAVVLIATEHLGGLALLLGAGTRIVAAVLAADMLVAI